jgi:hypothetical protein
MTRKAIVEIGFYNVKEGPTGGWFVLPAGSTTAISVHDNKASAIAAAKRYDAGDLRPIEGD